MAAFDSIFLSFSFFTTNFKSNCTSSAKSDEIPSQTLSKFMLNLFWILFVRTVYDWCNFQWFRFSSVFVLCALQCKQNVFSTLKPNTTNNEWKSFSAKKKRRTANETKRACFVPSMQVNTILLFRISQFFYSSSSLSFSLFF